MAKITYKAPPGDAEKLNWGGKEFKNGEGVDIDEKTEQGRGLLMKAQNNPYFEVSGGPKEGQQQDAQVIGNYKDAYSQAEYNLIRKPAAPVYGGAVPGPTETIKPSSATQGSLARDLGAGLQTTARSHEAFEQVFGGTVDEVNRGEAQSQTGKESESQQAKRGRPPGSKNK